VVTDQTVEARGSKWLRQPLVWVVVPLVLLLLLIVLVIGLYIAGYYLIEIQMDRQREALESFVAPTGWEDVTHPSYAGPFGDSFCMLPALWCNTHHIRRWKTPGPQSATTLKAAAEASGWKEIEFDSYRSDACEEEGEGSYWCPLRAVSGRVSFELRSSRSYSNYGWYVRLSAY